MAKFYSRLDEFRLYKLDWFLFSLIIIPFLALCFYTSPSADDFGYASRSIEQGALQAIQTEYNTWGGRFTSAFFLSINPLIYKSFFGYQIFTLFNVSSLLFSLFLFVKITLRQLNISTHVSLAIYMNLVIIYLSHLPSPPQGLFWLSGYINYTFPVTLFFFSIYLIFKFKPKKFYHPVSLLLGIFAFIFCGFNETTMFQLCILLLLINMNSFIKQRKINLVYIYISFMALFSSILVALAPGNAVRSSHFKKNPIFVSIFKSIGSSFEHFAQFLSVPLALGLLILFIIGKTNKSSFAHPFFKIAHQKSLFILFFFLFSGFLPAQFSMGGNPPERVDNIFYLFYVIILITWILQFSVQSTTSRDKWILEKGKWIITLFYISVFSWDNIRNSWHDLIFKAPLYKIEIAKNINIALNSEGQDVVLNSIHPIPKTIHFSQITADKNAWENKFYAKYFKLKSVRADNNEK